ncbi:hypothetical protein FHG87_000369 [Trinorchestia longiramus]|nr:hypothetical protein FHG87_000369 [Trinorchestia longiramus]
MSVVQDSHDKNLSCTYKLPIPIGELLKSYRQQGLQDASDPASMSASSRRKDKSSETILYFCSLENFESAIVYLSQELQALGLGNLNLTTAGNHSGRTHDALATAFTGGVHRGTLLQLDLVCLVNRYAAAPNIASYDIFQCRTYPSFTSSEKHIALVTQSSL